MHDVPVIGDYLISSTIGHGSTGKVKLGVHRSTGTQVAIKMIPRTQLNSRKITQAVERELAVLQLLDHPNLINLNQILQDDQYIYFVTEYMAGGELYHALNNKRGHMSELEAKELFRQIASALAWCHARHICHRDLKPENILLGSDKKSLKIADFGMAVMQPTHSLLHTSCGSPHYASPEIVRGIPYYGPATDIWSAGVILFVLLTGKLPFDDRHVGRLLVKIKSGRFRHIPDWVSPTAQDLIYRMLNVESSKRISINEVLSHPWMADVTVPFYSNPWNDIELLTSPAILDSNDLDGPTRETLKVLWRDLSHDQIITALMKKSPNAQKLTYQLLHQRKKRHLEGSTLSTKSKDHICDTGQITPSDTTTVCDSSYYFDYDDVLLSPPPEPNICFSLGPQLQPNHHSHHNDICSAKPIVRHIIPAATTIPTYIQKITTNTTIPTQSTILVHTTHHLPPIIPTSENDTPQTFLSGLKSLFINSFKCLFVDENTHRKIYLYCSATSEYIAARKLQYILYQQFEGSLRGRIYPDGHILWSGKIENDEKLSFVCKIRRATSHFHKISFVFLPQNVDIINRIVDQLLLYEAESQFMAKAMKDK